jgi:hypothetical protein
MIETEMATQLAYGLLSTITQTIKKKPTYRMFKDDYRFFFSPGAVPVVNEVLEEKSQRVVMVDIDCNKAIEFLKQRYNFYDPQELATTLQEEAESCQAIIHQNP